MSIRGYAVAAVTATGVQYGLVAILVWISHWPLLVASATAYAAGIVVNYFISHRLTFSPGAGALAAFPKFVAVSLCGLVLHSALILFVLNGLRVTVEVAQPLVSAAICCWNYGANRLWTFRGNARPDDTGRRTSDAVTYAGATEIPL